MEKNNGPFSSDRMDRALVALSLLGLLLCGVVLSNDRIFQFLFGSSHTSSAPIIGEITFAKNDTRRRSADFPAWEKAKVEQRIRLGDSVFTGEGSRSQVSLGSGGHVDLDQNSLVKFTTIDNIEVPDLALGNFSVNVNGKMKLAVGGEIVDVTGAGAVQVIVQNGAKPKFRLLKGSARLGSQDLELNRVASLGGPVQVAESKILPHDFEQALVHTDELYDVFENRSGKLVRRDRQKTIFNFPVAVKWSLEGKPSQVFGQVSPMENFSSIPDFFRSPAQTLSGTFRKTNLGQNFYRLSTDGKTWTKPQTFDVQTKYLESSAPHLKLASHKFFILENQVTISAQIESDLPHTVVEMSSSPDFPASESNAVWLSEKSFSLSVQEPKTVFLRAWGVNKDLQITAASAAIRVDVERPGLPEMPRLADKAIRAYLGESVNLSWSQASHARRYHVRILDSKGHIVAQKKVDAADLQFQAASIGQFKVQVASEDAFGRISKRTEAHLSVDPRPQPALAQQGLLRKPSNIDNTLSGKITPDIPEYLNRNYDKSKLSFETSAFTMYSKDQIESGRSNPTALLMGIQWMAWSGAHGFEGLFRAKAADIGTPQDATVSPLQIEGRYHYRWFLPFNPFSKFRQSEFSFIGGYEYYHNFGHGLFSPGYQLVKGGFGLAFPLSHRWDTGGELLYGQGFESSYKYEMSGYLHYYWEKQWSLGVGYRVHLFEAGSDGASPIGLPYREGFGEAYSELRWHY